ncbi:glycogen debranching N-terminal domain-containing protein [Actinopolymorpha alba]|uniref:amylo-alpha-1,6-glucosidase n=1 Tax=Actinopolymorpha alba TaxID=533267 RepID=UPI00037E40AD|nr:glycogen debranching N-terminal domain-containing protein [Actinopolymorpha alba]
MEQPFLHELVSCVAAPTVALSGADGQVRPGGVQGVLHHDRRALSELVVDVDGHEPVPVGHHLRTAGNAHFVGVLRHLGDPGADPTVRVERERHARPGCLEESLLLVNAARTAITTTVRLRASVDLAGMDAVKQGASAATLPAGEAGPAAVTWGDDRTRVTLRAETGKQAAGTPSEPPTIAVDADGRAVFTWQVTVPARTTWSMGLRLEIAEEAPAATANSFLPAASGPGWEPVTVAGPAVLTRLVDQSIDDLAALALADPLAPGDVFLAAGSPWFFTLFGRDSLWAARLTLPLGTDLARGTLRTLARRQGTRHDPATAEAPGKILHEVRQEPVKVRGHAGLPPIYFGTVDATALWICLLHDAWRWGMAAADVAELLDPLEAALGWLLTDADADGDGFLEYVDESGHGLANQGWKDSGDSIQFPDGRIADPSIALSEAQAYAHEAALAGATLLEAFGRPGAERLRDWAGALRERFRTTFWVSDARGRFPAIALDGSKTPVNTATSNLGHLLGTGLLDAGEAATVAARLAQDDLDCGYGLRTMSAHAAGFNPLGYHAGSVWPHDTAIAVLGLAREGHATPAASLASGLLRIAPDFAYRIPELFAGTNAREGEAVLAYPASCRPQAWSAAAAITLLQAALGLAADVPSGVLRVAPAEAFASWFPLRVSGLRLAGHPLTVDVDATGKISVETTAPVTIEYAD